jgi:hypothetical protein
MKRGPRKKRQAQIDGRGVQRVNGPIQVQAQVFAGVELAGAGNQDQSQVYPNLSGAAFVGHRQRVAHDQAPEPGVVKLAI